MIISGGLVVTDRTAENLDIRIQGEIITEIGPSLKPHFGDEQIIDATGKLVLPGGVDVHTHMDLLVGTLRATDSFLTGTIAAACGGTTTIVDHMAFGPKGCNLMHQVDTYHQLAEGKAVIDYGFHGVVQHVDEAILAELPQLIDAGITSVKFYMTYNDRLDDDSAIQLFAKANELGILVCVHCENHAILTFLKEDYLAQGLSSPIYHAKSRPPQAEAEAVFRVASLAYGADNAPVYIVHTSSAAALEAIAAVGFDSRAIFETCPQYLVLDQSSYQLPGDEGLKFIISPPLRTAQDQEALWQGMADGRISVIGTDHCPFFFETEKILGRDDFSKCPNGMPGVELRLAIIYSEGVVKRGLSLNRMVELNSTAPARTFGLYPQKGTISVGSDADIVIFDPQKKTVVSKSLLHENVDYTPYEGLELAGYPVLTISRGQIIMKDGSFLGSQGRGKFIKRKTYPKPSA